MGNVVGGIIDKLKDPSLVRGVQEAFGVRECEPAPSGGQEGAGATATEGPRLRGKKGTNKNEASNGAILSLAVRALKKKRTKRKPIASYLMDSPPSSPELTTPPPEPADIVVETYPFMDAYFKFVTMIGYEPFFITFMPYLYWNVDVLMARHIIILWCVSIYVGGAAKNTFRLMRPSSPPAIRLEVNLKLEQEYGFPSTHAVIAAVFSFHWLYACCTRYDFFYPMLLLSLLWALSVTISRVYLGMHTVLDVVGGVLIALVTVVTMVPFLDSIDTFIFDYQYSPYVLIGLSIVAMVVYPTTDQWSNDRGDTGAIVGAALGVVLGCHRNGYHPDDLLTGPFPVLLPSSHQMGYNMLRFIIGVLLVFPTRFIMKLLCFRLLPAIMPDQGILEVQKRPLVELPYKLITYTSLGLTMTCMCPVVFDICQVARHTHT